MIKLNRPQCPNIRALENENYKHPDNKAALKSASFDKCMYCESKVTHVDYGDVEHIKPKSKFPDLTYEWSNLGYACGKCNREGKGNKYDDHFINPYQDDPENYLIPFGSVIFARDGNGRGEITIDIVNINRPELLEKRNGRIEKIRPLITRYFQCTIEAQKEAIFEQIIEEAKEDKEYSLSIKHLLKYHDIC